MTLRHGALGWLLRLFALACCVGLVTGGETTRQARAAEPGAKLFDGALATWDLEGARDALPRLDDGPGKRLRIGILAWYEADYALAESALLEAMAMAIPGSPEAEEAAHYLRLSRGALSVLKDATTVTSPSGDVVAVFADSRDTLLAPYLFDAMKQARAAIGDELGLDPLGPVRFEFLDNPADLAAVTPLSSQAIRTTSTVGITKYRRIVMISPRVMVYGYGWLDTAVHEYVHYVLTMRTRNLAPVWLQEGLAKLFETRWREPNPAGPGPGAARLLHSAIAKDELVTFDQMHPSLAMLPSQEMASLAYAEVQTMLGLVRERRGQAGIGDLLDRVTRGVDAQEALAGAWGEPFDAFFEEWKSVTKTRTARTKDGTVRPIEFKQPGADDAEAVDPSLFGEVFSHLGGGRARQHARLGVLLTLRGHLQAAAIEYEKARKADRRVARDPKLARRLGELYVQLDRNAEAVPLLDIAANEDPDNANLAAAQGHARLRTGDLDGARAALDRAIRTNPFIPQIHCDLAELATDPARATAEQTLCGR